MAYAHSRAKLTSAVIGVDLRRGYRPKLVIMSYFKGDAHQGRSGPSTTIALTEPSATPQRRRYFLCPITGENLTALAFRAGAWGGKTALRLKNQSQRSEKYNNRIKRANVDAPRVRAGGERQR